jgi:riboflavin kinase/FMN adenylyltransferase
LGQPYFLTGVIQKGKQLGRTIGFPTANLKIAENYKLIPQKGVYIVRSNLNDKTVYGMMNIGINPTVGGASTSIEIYFLDYSGDLYDQKIQVSLLEHMRSEEKFASIDLLKAQLEKDKNILKTFVANL